MINSACEGSLTVAVAAGSFRVRSARLRGAQTPPQYIQQVAAITQQDHRHGGDVFEVDRIGQLNITVGQGFHQLGRSQHTGCCIGMEDIDRGVAVNQ